jgi:hypothetical protein
MTVLKTIAWIMLALIAALTIAVGLLLWAPMTYFGLLQSQIKSATEYEIEVQALQLDLFPPRVAASNLKLSNPQASAEQDLLTVNQLEIHIDAGRYFDDAPTWWRASASGIDLRVIQKTDGTSNWSLPGVTDNRSEQTSDDEPIISEGDSRNQSLLWRFSAIDISDLDFMRANKNEALKLEVSQLQINKDADERLRVELDANYRDQALTASGTLALPSSDKARAVDFRASIFGSDISLNGIVGSDGITPGEARFSAQIDDLTTLSRLLDQDLAVFTPIDLQGSLQAPEQGSWSLSATGQVGGRDLSFNAAANTAQATYTLDKFALTFGESVMSANGTVNSSEQTITGSVSSQQLAVDQLLSFAASGDDQPASLPNMTAMLERLQQWAIDLDLRLADVHYQGYRAQNIAMDVKSKTDELNLSGELGSLTATAERTESASPAAQNNDNTAAQNSDNTAAQNNGNAAAQNSDNTVIVWQVVSPLAAEVTLGLDQQSPSGGWPLRVNVETSGARGSLETSVLPNVTDLTSGELEIRVESFSALEGIDMSQWRPLLPVAIDTSFNTDQSALQLSPFTIVVGDSELGGKLVIDRGANPISIDGDLHSPEIDLNDFSTTSLDDIKGLGENVDSASDDVISDEPINWGWLNAASVDLGLTLDALRFNQTNFRDVKAHALLNDGNLNVEPFDANLSQGKVRGYLRVEQTAAGANVDGRLMVTGLAPADLGQEKVGLIDGGETDFMLDLRASGNTPQALASSLNGEIALEIQRATIRNNIFEVIGSDILLQTINLINPFSERKEDTELECVAVYFKAEDGVLTSPEQLVIETGEIKIRGGGTINLNDETLMLDFVPTPRDGFGISLSDLASVVRIGGTLANPQPVADPSGILKAGATIGAAIATGGLSLLAQGLFDRMRSASTACGIIFDNVTEDEPDQNNSDQSDAVSQ